ncbi:MAG: sigma-54 dependent transcriptional regulator [Gemmatimonadales bacterium]|nr:sigma-54 dependent transcriptional regulator [Gemmatimonadales bacterium]
MKPVILVIDDEEAIRLFLEATLKDEGYDVLLAANGQSAIELLGRSVPDLVLLDLMLPDMSGIEVLKKIREMVPHLCVVMITAYSETDSAVQAMKLDAYDYVNKPIQLGKLFKVISRGLNESVEARERFRLLDHGDLFVGLDEVVPSVSPAMLEVYDLIRKIAGGGSTTVLIEGESGVGKDVIANQIHRNSSRADYPFLEINCASLPDKLLESELFGHEKGAFTDAQTQKMGLLELAHSGSIFLDEIGEMAPPVQVKLLRVLEKMKFRRVGGIEDILVDVRIIAATNLNLASEVKAGKFREDLFYRLKVVEIYVPALRSRLEDITPLADFFLQHFNTKFGREFRDISSDAKEFLLNYPWPGNIRELKNIMERVVLLGEGNTIRRKDLSFLSSDPSGEDFPVRLQEALRDPIPDGGLDLEGLVREFETILVKKAFLAAEGNQTKGAGLLGLNRDKFRYRLKQYGIKEDEV